MEIVPIVHYENLKLIVAEWTTKGLLDNSVIDTLWQYFTKNIPVSDKKSIAALHILGLAAIGRRTIISRNVQLISKVVFGVIEEGKSPRGLNNLLLTKTACDVLALMGMEKQTITDTKPPFTISPDDEIWRDLFGILLATVAKPIHFYNKALTSAVNLLFKCCSKPYKICEEFARNVTRQLGDANELERFLLIRVVHLFGEMALRLLNFLDENVYKELKRRHFMREERKEKSKEGKKVNKTKKTKQAESASKSVNMSVLNESVMNASTVS